jgi:SagB-type dehydrogenase family enzyme
LGDKHHSALDYHEETKHSELSVRTSAHYLDWENRPSPFKVCRGLPSVHLPHDFPRPEGDSLLAVRDLVPKVNGRGLDLKGVAELLFFSAGLTRKMRVGPDFYYMRAAAATGALYPIELYLVCGDIEGLKASVYHFNPLSFSLVRIREGDWRHALGDACGWECITSPMIIVFTSLAWRNAWKYGARSYRHWFWDAGVIAANLLATAASEGFPTGVNIGFVDSKVDRLLGVKEKKEATVAVVPVGVAPAKPPVDEGPAVPELSLKYELLSKEEVDYPSIWKANEATSLATLADVGRWRGSFKPQERRYEANPITFPLNLAEEKDRPSPPLAETILRRGSTRRFARQSISLEQLSSILDASSGSIPLDFLPQDHTLIDFYLVANAVHGLSPGSYFFDRASKSLIHLKEGQFRNTSAYLCLEQPLFGDASAVLFLMTDLNHVTSTLGERGYRAAQFEAGVRAGKVYLASYALGLGASGSTFYDDAVTEFFSPNAKGKSTMIAVGAGIPAYKAKPGMVLPRFEP